MSEVSKVEVKDLAASQEPYIVVLAQHRTVFLKSKLVSPNLDMAVDEAILIARGEIADRPTELGEGMMIHSQELYAIYQNGKIVWMQGDPLKVEIQYDNND